MLDITKIKRIREEGGMGGLKKKKRERKRRREKERKEKREINGPTNKST